MVPSLSRWQLRASLSVKDFRDGSWSAFGKYPLMGFDRFQTEWNRLPRNGRGSVAKQLRERVPKGERGRISEALQNGFRETVAKWCRKDSVGMGLEGACQRKRLASGTRRLVAAGSSSLPFHLPVHLPEALPPLEGDCEFWNVL